MSPVRTMMGAGAGRGAQRVQIVNNRGQVNNIRGARGRPMQEKISRTYNFFYNKVDLTIESSDEILFVFITEKKSY